MGRLIALAAALMIATAPASAQDYTGNVNPSAWTGPTVMTSAIDAQARRARARSRSSTTLRQRRGCAQKARYRAQLGARNPQVVQLYRLRRRMGL